MLPSTGSSMPVLRACHKTWRKGPYTVHGPGRARASLLLLALGPGPRGVGPSQLARGPRPARPGAMRVGPGSGQGRPGATQDPILFSRLSTVFLPPKHNKDAP